MDAILDFFSLKRAVGTVIDLKLKAFRHETGLKSLGRSQSITLSNFCPFIMSEKP